MQTVYVYEPIAVTTGYGINTNSSDLRWEISADVISSGDSAIRAAGSDSEFHLSFARVVGLRATGFELVGDRILLDNSSHIHGLRGIEVTGSLARIYNDDRISASRDEAILIKTAARDLTIISNFADIAAQKVAILTVSGRLLLQNHGHIIGDVKLVSGADTVTSPGTIAGNVRLGGGGDLFDATGGLVFGTVNGGKGDDILKGGLTADHLHGGRGDDVLDGGAGRDVLTGGRGADTFVFADLAVADKVRDFEAGRDTIRIDNAFLPGLADGPLAKGAFHVGAEAADADDRIIYDRKSGALKYDADGDGAGGSITVAKLAPGLALSHHHFDIA